MANIEELNDNNFETSVLKSEKLVLVDFWAPWCGPCRKMSPVLEQIQNEMIDSIKIAKLDTDKFPAIASEYGVFSLPSMILFKDGDVKEVMVGLMPKSSVVSNIKKYLS
ncbi:MAG: thioredoxin [Candidatus Gastranaerophilales bacterium]|nr:thioredoxin [Candidatus Gastranaerophilales bacterium]